MKEEILTAKIKQVDLTPKIVKLLMGEFKDRPEVFKTGKENSLPIKEGTYEEFLKANNIQKDDSDRLWNFFSF